MTEPALITISGAGTYINGTYRSFEIDVDRSDTDNPFLRVWLEADDEQDDGNHRIAGEEHSDA